MSDETIFLPGTAVDLAKQAKLSRATQTFLRGGEVKPKGRGVRVLFETVPKEQARELIEFFEEWLGHGKHGIAEAASIRMALERLGGTYEPSPKDEERQAAARLKNIRKAQEARQRKQHERQEKIERYEAAISKWLANHKTAPTAAELQDGHPLAVKKLNNLVRQEAEATQRVKDLYGQRGQVPDTAANEDRRTGLAAEIEVAIEERNLVRRTLRKQRIKMSSPDRQRAATLPVPQPEDFGLTRKDVR